MMRAFGKTRSWHIETRIYEPLTVCVDGILYGCRSGFIVANVDDYLFHKKPRLRVRSYKFLTNKMFDATQSLWGEGLGNQ